MAVPFGFPSWDGLDLYSGQWGAEHLAREDLIPNLRRCLTSKMCVIVASHYYGP